MKPHITTIPRQRGEPQAAAPGVTEKFDVGVTLDRLIEYRLILPLVLEHLGAKALQETEDERRERIHGRIAVIVAFQRDVDDAPYDESRSIDLTPQESEAASQRLLPNAQDREMRSGEARLRTEIAAGIGRCIGAAWSALRTAQEHMNGEVRASED